MPKSLRNIFLGYFFLFFPFLLDVGGLICFGTFIFDFGGNVVFWGLGLFWGFICYRFWDLGWGVLRVCLAPYLGLFWGMV